MRIPETRMRRLPATLASPLVLATILTTAGVFPVKAHADVLFIDGGYSQLCSLAAHNLEAFNRVDITGSHLGLAPLEVCNRAISEVDPVPGNKAASHNNRGVLWFAQKQLEMALEDFDSAIRLNPELTQAYINKGYTLSALKRWAESIEAYDQGLSMGTVEAGKALFNRGIAHEELGNIRQAYQDYKQAAATDPLWEEPQRELARFSTKNP